MPKLKKKEIQFTEWRTFSLYTSPHHT